MLKIMIVDDEFYFREALKVSICWEEFGFTICGEAKNGKDAIEKIELLDPDIIIVDINMPIMDGFELVQNLKEKGIGSKVIILSGHSEFNYAKQAVEIGAHNYILKPVNEEELINTLCSIRKVIDKERNIQIEIDRLKRQLKDSAPMIKDKFLNELLQGSLDKDENEIMKKMEYLNNNIDSEYYMAVTIEVYNEKNEDWNNEDKQIWEFTMSNIINEILSEGFKFDICYDNDDRICIIIGATNTGDKYDFKQLLENKLECLREAVYNRLKLTVTIGVGNIRNTFYDIAGSYKESLIALKSKLIVGRNKVITYSSLSDSEIKVNLFTAEHRSQLLKNMRIGDEKEVQNLINQIFKEVRKKNIHHEILFVICIEMVSVCLEFIGETGLSFQKILPHNHLNIIEEIQSKGSLDEIEKWMGGVFKDTLEVVKINRSSRAANLVGKVKKYIEENYRNDELSIDEISKSLFVNYAHLCFVFKRETGTTINEYLTEFRMNKAKELFDSGNIVVLDVAGRVGYADANYFGKCFKKYYGLAPRRYIENISR